jgi:DNA-directed RNA polymerase subunit beta'
MDIDMVRISLASPQKVLEWSRGEVKKPETLNYRTGRPEPEGLFCERIFGPTRDYECACGKFRKVRGEGRICDRCGVEITNAKVRRKRMGFIRLAAPVAHIWFSRGIPNYLSLLLNIPPRDVESILAYATFIFVKLDRRRLADPDHPGVGIFRAKDPEAAAPSLDMERISAIISTTGRKPEDDNEVIAEITKWMDGYEGALVEAVNTEITSILRRGQERGFLRPTYPLDLILGMLGKRESRDAVFDPVTGEVAIPRGERLTYAVLQRALQADVRIEDIPVTDKASRRGVTLSELLKDKLSEEELDEEIRDTATGELVARASTALSDCIWDALARFKNITPLRIANRSARESYERAREKRMKEIAEIIGGIQTLLRSRPYDPEALDPPEPEARNYQIDGVAYRNLFKLKSVIRRRLQGVFTPDDIFVVAGGAEAFLLICRNLNFPALHGRLAGAVDSLRKVSTDSASIKVRLDRLIRRANLVGHIIDSGNRPEWMILEILPVIPPDLRPLVQLEGGRHATSDLNELYRTVISRNNRLIRLAKINAPELVLRNEKRILQEAVDALLDNTKKARPIEDINGRPLKSLADSLKGKQGRFRQNLLGKRVDYSGRAVIVVGPQLRLWQCGVPRAMALELFKPFVIYQLVHRKFAENTKIAKRMLERVPSLPPADAAKVWESLEHAVKGKVVLLNRAPTLHRLSVQAFEPILVDGESILLHPLVCSAYNADFDGDQMAVHLPLSIKAQVEARLLMLSTRGLLVPADGSPIAYPSQDMVLGIHYLTLELPAPREKKPEDEWHQFSDLESVARAYHMDVVGIHEPIWLRVPCQWNGKSPEPNGKKYDLIKTTPGRAMFNIHLPEALRYINKTIDKRELKKLAAQCFGFLGEEKTVDLMDDLKDMGFRIATRAGASMAVVDVVIPESKRAIVEAAEREVLKLEEQGINPETDKERWSKRVVRIWERAVERISEAVEKLEDPKNILLMMVRSGSRGNPDQMRQLGGMRGLMADPSGRIIPMPIKANFREGLTVQEYFISTHGGRKGLTDTALRTAKSGYLTRRLVDLAQEVFITEDDCQTRDGISLRPIVDNESGTVYETIGQRAVGRIAAATAWDPQTGEFLAECGEEIDEDAAHQLDAIHLPSIFVRSALICENPFGICAICYGRNLATGRLVEVGESVGVMAAQAIGEPGTQLTLRTFHTGGIAGEGVRDITYGLPRAEMFFEVYSVRFSPKKSGAVIFREARRAEVLEVVQPDRQSGYVKVFTSRGDEKKIEVPPPRKIKVAKGDTVHIGDALTDGYKNPYEILEVLGTKAAEQYIIDQIQQVYRSQDVATHDKHFEVIVSQMFRFVQVKDPGDSPFLPEAYMNRYTFQKLNERLRKQGKRTATAVNVLLGVKKAALGSESFLAGASFQETARVLSAAGLEGRADLLRGLKENIIIGRPIPCGTGFPVFRAVEYRITEAAHEVPVTEEEVPIRAAFDTEAPDTLE